MSHSYSVSPSKKFENHQFNPFLASRLMKYTVQPLEFWHPLAQKKRTQTRCFCHPATK